MTSPREHAYCCLLSVECLSCAADVNEPCRADCDEPAECVCNDLPVPCCSTHHAEDAS